MNPPAISIGLPVFNGENRIGKALDSILNQDFQDFEVVICDNASTDNTRSICLDYAQSDGRVRYFRNETNIGVNPNHDRVFHLSKGKYFAWFADDLEYLPGMLSRCFQAIKSAPPSVVLVYSKCDMIFDGQSVGAERGSFETRGHTPQERLKALIRHATMVNQFFGLAKREILAKTQLNGRYASSDYVLLAELAMLGELWELPEVLIRRQVDSNRGTAAVHRDQKAWNAWSGAGTAGFKDAWLSNRERLALEYLLAAWRSPIQPMKKLKCLLCILPIYYSRTSPAANFALKLARPWRWVDLRHSRAMHSTNSIT
ncbi:MAG TPA: glycosyltransferase family 2 protein [Verrucomicrobiae bacterium]|jgi:glycosyltransferase involved in cell wall biosynthesis|nr:glycosyltransferase family 2 protein [Verrucomicrobiae bacterium]